MIDYKKTALNLLGFVAVCATVLGMIALGIYFWPFLVGVVIALLLERLVNLLVVKTKVPRKAVGTILVILIFLLIAGLFVVIISSLVNEAISLSTNIPNIYESLKIGYNAIYNTATEILNRTPDTITKTVYDFGLNILSKFTTIANNTVNSALNFIMFIPNIMIYIIITFLATLFLVTDRRTIKKYAQDVLPSKILNQIATVVSETFKSLGQYIKAQLIIISITFVELLIAFIILGQDYPLTLALLVCLIDALPILGTGIVILPWAIYSAVTGNIGFGIGLLIAYLVITVVRQLVEPKIVSKNLGVHPFLTLLAMYFAFKLFGLVGLIIGPIVMVIFKNVFEIMFEVGYLKRIFVMKKENK